MNALRDSGGYDVRRHHLHHPARTHFTSSVASRLAATTGALVCRSHDSREPRDNRGGGGRGVRSRDLRSIHLDDDENDKEVG